MHKVSMPEDPEASCLECRINPMKLVCTCKLSRKTGICPHIAAVNHRCAEINIGSELMRMDKKKKKKNHRQATGRRMLQPQSSEEEESEVDDNLSGYESEDETDE